MLTFGTYVCQAVVHRQGRIGLLQALAISSPELFALASSCSKRWT